MANIIPLNQLNWNSPEVEIYTRLTEGDLRCKQHPEDAVFVAESPYVINIALENGYVPVSFLMENKHVQGTAEDLLKKVPSDIPVFTGDSVLLSKMTGFYLTRGVLAVFQRQVLPTPYDICNGANRIAILENVMNPQNIGAIFRSATALGIDGILLTDEGSDPLTRRASRVSLGSVFQIPWTILKKGEDWINLLQSYGFRTMATVLRDDSLDIRDASLKNIPKLGIVVGNEGYGLKPETIENCDYAVKIPMYHGVDSLNVSTAAAICFYEFCNK